MTFSSHLLRGATVASKGRTILHVTSLVDLRRAAHPDPSSFRLGYRLSRVTILAGCDARPNRDRIIA